jgi:hypothetical protein
MKTAAAVLTLVASLVTPVAQAERFVNSFIAFTLPQGWACEQEDDTFVCMPPAPQDKPVAAVMILAAKFAGPQDTLAAYLQHLEHHPAAAKAGAVLAAPKLVTIGDTLWVDGVLFEAELPNYVTRYLATSREGLAVLWTFSAHQTEYDRYVAAALQSIHTLSLQDDWRTLAPSR